MSIPFRKILVCLIAVFAMSAVMASAALADESQEFKKVGGGEVVKKHFTDKSGPSTLTTLTIVIKCKKDKSSGEIEGKARVKNVTQTFEECKGVKSGVECEVKSPGAAKETIVTQKLKGELGEVTKPTGTSGVGLALEPEVKEKGFVTLEGSCIPETKVEGSVIGEVKPVNVFQATGELVFAEEGGHQKIQEYEPDSDIGEIKDTLKAFGVAARFVSTDEITFEESIEVTTGV